MLSDDIIKSLIEAVPPIVATLFGGFVTIKLFMMGRQLNAVHILTNSSYGAALKLNAANSRWRADMSKKKVDIKAADEAEALLEDHNRQQALVDAKPKQQENL